MDHHRNCMYPFSPQLNIRNSPIGIITKIPLEPLTLIIRHLSRASNLWIGDSGVTDSRDSPESPELRWDSPLQVTFQRIFKEFYLTMFKYILVSFLWVFIEFSDTNVVVPSCPTIYSPNIGEIVNPSLIHFSWFLFLNKTIYVAGQSP